MTKELEKLVMKWRNWCYWRHDVYCNQQYDHQHRYSFHLKAADAAYSKFKSLLAPEDRPFARMGVAGHDLIEDARTTYNDIINEIGPKYGKTVADIIYACTEVRGHNADERHGPEYLETLKKSRLGVFVKMCDCIANLTYSILTNSDFFKKHAKYHIQQRLELLPLYPEFKPMFDYMTGLIAAFEGPKEPIIDSVGSLTSN